MRCKNCGSEMASMLALVWDGANWLGEQKSASKIREYVLAQLRLLDAE
jgi:hypothetical protein